MATELNPTLAEFAKQFEGLVCRWDGSPLTGIIDHYNHPGGVLLSGFEMPQWISMKCSQCGYDWSFTKLPILQFHTKRWLEAKEVG